MTPTNEPTTAQVDAALNWASDAKELWGRYDPNEVHPDITNGIILAAEVRRLRDQLGAERDGNASLVENVRQLIAETETFTTDLAARDALCAELSDGLAAACGEIAEWRREHANEASRGGAESPYANGKHEPQEFIAIMTKTPETCGAELARLRVIELQAKIDAINCPKRTAGGDCVTRPWSEGKCAYCGDVPDAAIGGAGK